MPRSRRAALSSSLPPQPSAETRAEDFYYAKQLGAGTEVVVRLQGGDVLRGSLAWHDRRAIAVRVEAPAREVVIPKSAIVALAKAEAEAPRRRPGRSR